MLTGYYGKKRTTLIKYNREKVKRFSSSCRCSRLQLKLWQCLLKQIQLINQTELCWHFLRLQLHVCIHSRWVNGQVCLCRGQTVRSGTTGNVVTVKFWIMPRWSSYQLQQLFSRKLLHGCKSNAFKCITTPNLSLRLWIMQCNNEEYQIA